MHHGKAVAPHTWRRLAQTATQKMMGRQQGLALACRATVGSKQMQRVSNLGCRSGSR